MVLSCALLKKMVIVSNPGKVYSLLFMNLGMTVYILVSNASISMAVTQDVTGEGLKVALPSLLL